ncbi:hypothetical protein H072_7269 [Dactylellina haptotyla CBS 200.50]|uniref:Malic enzyme n=1 Tax=Dactylellina haptotyla (strain CBS 200.50) TaxID=1284197 RepID=S8A7K1_DACHA|nr:hypothetical protein H072_7269 [Dactylellina haptotyla CBS 200.50]
MPLQLPVSLSRSPSAQDLLKYSSADAIDGIARNPSHDHQKKVTASLPQHTVPKNPITMSTRFDTSYDPQLRSNLHVSGLVPPVVESHDIQIKRCLKAIASKKTEIDKYLYLSHLRNSNFNLFYRLLIDNMKNGRSPGGCWFLLSLVLGMGIGMNPHMLLYRKLGKMEPSQRFVNGRANLVSGAVQEITPLVYTPVVGEACENWSHIFAEPEGLYLSWKDRGHLAEVIRNWPENEVDITVVTDGSRILGLGDLGVGGIGISIGKLALYTACAGIHPTKTLPIVLDLGTDNERLLNDELYLGSKMKRLGEKDMMKFLDEMMVALKARWPSIIIQFEDFKNPFPSLAKYQNMYTCFNDDIQGTGAVVLAGVMNAVRDTGVLPKDQRLVFLGAGSAGVGVARQIMEMFKKEGHISEDEARKQFYLVDSKGLVTNDRGDKLQEHKLIFSRSDNNGQQYKTLDEVLDYVKPTILMGLSTIGGAFNEGIIKKMTTFSDRPVIFPLSNPVSKSECTFVEAMTFTDEKVLFASGSPFPNYTGKDGKVYEPGQGNNMYVFPGIGMGAIVSQASLINQDMIYASAEYLADSLTPEERADGLLYPRINRIREVSARVALGVVRAAERNHVARNPEIIGMDDETLVEYIKDKMYDPSAVPTEAEETHDGMWNWLTSKLSLPWSASKL